MKFKKIIIVLIFILTIAISYIYSRDIYKFQMQTYYLDFKNLKYDDMLARARDLNKNEKYKELGEYLKDMLIVFDESPEIIKLYGMNYIKLGDEKKGIDLILSIIDREKIDPSLMHRIVEIMYNQQLYGDITGLVNKQGPGDDYSLLFFYGAALLKTGRAGESVEYLSKAVKIGEHYFSTERQIDLYLFLGNAYENIGKINDSFLYYKKAWNLNQRDPEIKKALLGIYRKKGMYREAEKLIRM